MLGAAVEPVVSWPETQSQRPKGERHENAERGRGGGVVDGAGLRADPEHQPDPGIAEQIAGGEGAGSEPRTRPTRNPCGRFPTPKPLPIPGARCAATTAPKAAAAPARKSKTGSANQ